MMNDWFKALLPYIKISRFEHWFKNLLILPGAVLATRFLESAGELWAMAGKVGDALLPICLLSSGNYIINEILDVPGDALHPHKRHRPLAIGNARIRWAWILAILYYSAAFALSWRRQNADFSFCLLLFFLIGGIAYNVPPLRLKEIAFLDVVTESANNPIRLLLGWYALTAKPFSSWNILIGYWAFGAFLMSAKRLSELRHLRGEETAVLYRRSFRHYSEKRLLMLMVFTGLACLVMFGAILIQQHVRILPVLFLGIIFVLWVFLLVYRNSVFPREPEKVWKEPFFLTYVILAGLAILGMAILVP